jgi:transposase InsO family protein
MSQTASAGTAKPYGVERVCQVWEQARSTFYDRQERVKKVAQGIKPGRRGPKPPVPDDELLELIRGDLAASPFRGEGHRKVWGRLHFGKGLRVSRKRVLRLMRENHLLSPYRGRQGEPIAHDGTITTEAPNVMWGTDGTKVFTLEHGWVWVFAAVEHWNAECVGWHVTKEGNRYAALEPISQGLTSLYGSVAADVARGLRLRMDHGSQYLSDHFVNQVRFWGINPSFAFVAEPETNGVAERFNRTLKEQAIYGRAFRTIEEVRQAVGKFVEDYNAEWRVEKNGFVSPREAREAWFAALAKKAA